MNKHGRINFVSLFPARQLAMASGVALSAASLSVCAQTPPNARPAAFQKPVSAPAKPPSASPPHAILPGGAQPLELRMKFKPGDISRYQMTMRANIVLPGQPAQAVTRYDTDISMLVQQRVLKTNSDGSADVAIATLNGSGTVNGQYFKPAINEKPAVITFDARNNIVTAKDLPKDASGADVTGRIFQSGALSTQGVYLPKQSVKIGDHWSQKVNIASLGSGSSGTVQTTLTRLETVGLYQTARLRSVMKIPFVIADKTAKNAVPLSGLLNMVYDSNLALTEGKVVRSTGSGDITVTVNVPGASASPPVGKRGGKSNTPKKPEPVNAAQKVTVKLQLGNNLLTQ